MRLRDAVKPTHLPLLAFLVIAAALAYLFSVQQDQISERNASSRDARVVICREIERLKMGQREDAIESFSRLDETLKLLNLRRTPEIVAVARRNRDEQLRRFAPYPGGCAAFADNPDPGALSAG